MKHAPLILAATLALGIAATLNAQQAFIDFSTLPTDTAWGDQNVQDGDTIFTEDSITATIHFHDYLGLDPQSVAWDTAAFIWHMNDSPYGPFQGNYLWFGNTEVEFDMSQLSITHKTVTFQVSGKMSGPQFDTATGPHLSVNGEAPFHGNLLNFSGTIATGISASFVLADSLPENGGLVTLTGNIQTLRVGGFEFGVDDIKVTELEITGVSPVNTHQVGLDVHPNGGSQMLIQYGLENSGATELSVYDLLGHRVAVLEDGIQHAGKHTVSLDRSGMPSGVYLVVLQSGDQVATKKIVMP